ncbi:hypothetical protein A6V39_04470 [Candidatus Mycoplasma haematobovis]|uniref:DUF31 domain-containing protein n=1 Tax=Candidatus Mycoplasma haematobovis TaxID=432608 RepID=A0A1A9QEL9_9MOLU|nr:trypsin-like peptidase domain-containing protein [Candidatus Mycoplasma haematobovis]OAL10139.1 hypothetical protein A6V39_04470 [Candidatus Mycoplasma haematobovis]
MLSNRPILNLRFLIPTALSIAALTNSIIYSSHIEYFQSPRGDFFVPEHLKKVNADVINNSQYNKFWTQKHSTFNHGSKTGFDKGKAEKILKKINDYTFKLAMPCDSGTGWILDYALPKGTEKYPKKWFIATNAHVASRFRFTSNPYQQELPIPEANTKALRDYYRDKEIILDLRTTTVCSLSQRYGYSELGLWKDSHTKDNFETVKDAKLFYAPINFLGSRYSARGYAWRRDNYYKDFAVIEVDFESEDQAKRITDDFYNKYPVDPKGNQDKEALNFFDKELMQKDSLTDKPYYIAGYPVNGNLDVSLKNNFEDKSIHSTVAVMPHEAVAIKNAHGESIIGHVDAGKIDKRYKNTTTYWNGKHYYSWGYNYLLNNVTMGGGASGSLVVDEDGNVLGLYRMHDSANNFGFAEPLRSEGIYVNNKIVVPKYDLINGSPGQTSSYKDQLKRYYPQLETFLTKKWDSQATKSQR